MLITTRAVSLSRLLRLGSGKQQKLSHDCQARPHGISNLHGERMFVFMPSSKQTKAYKFTRALHGPYRARSLKKVMQTGVVVLPIDRPN